MSDSWVVPARVSRVVDADTVVLDLDLGWKVWRVGERCRLSGINSPEIDTLEGKAARDFVERLIGFGDQVTFVSRSLDKFGRPLGVIRLSDGRSLNDLILSSGHAVPMNF